MTDRFCTHDWRLVITGKTRALSDTGFWYCTKCRDVDPFQWDRT